MEVSSFVFRNNIMKTIEEAVDPRMLSHAESLKDGSEKRQQELVAKPKVNATVKFSFQGFEALCLYQEKRSLLSIKC